MVCWLHRAKPQANALANSSRRWPERVLLSSSVVDENIRVIWVNAKHAAAAKRLFSANTSGVMLYVQTSRPKENVRAVQAAIAGCEKKQAAEHTNPAAMAARAALAAAMR